MKLLKLITIVILNVWLTGCGTSGDVDRFVTETKKKTVSNIKPLPKLKEYEQFIYSANKLRDPFSVPISEITLKINTKVEKAIVQQQRPDAERPKEYLEGMPLDSFTMVGTLKKRGENWALLIDKNGAVHRVKEGNYLGENSGQIKKITEDTMDIDEIVSDGLGNWISRKTNLSIGNKQ